MQKLMIVSGGSRGLGLSLVGLALDAGWQVVELSRHGAANSHPNLRPNLHHIALDLAHADEGLAAFTALAQQLVQQEWQEVVLVNNAAAVGPILPVHLLDDAAMQSNAEINFMGAIRLMASFVRVFAPHNAKKSLLNISSGAALKGYPSWSLYCAAKAGIENFIRALASEQEDQAKPIRCANFGPGVMDTDMQSEIRATPSSMFRDVGRFQQLKEQDQLRSPQQVAQAVMLLLQDGIESGRRYVVDEFDGRVAR